MLNLPDYHIHTYLCKHATGFPLEYVKEAENKGILEVCFCDHMPSYQGYDPKHRMEPKQLHSYVEIIEETRNNSLIPVLFGIEADYFRGCESYIEGLVQSQNFDLVLGSVHFLDSWGFDDPDQLPVWDLVDIEETWERYFQLLEELVDTGLFDVVAHIDLPKKFGHILEKEDLLRLSEPLLDRIANKGMAIEINTSGLRKPVGEIYPSLELLRLAQERHIPICFGSDAHEPSSVGYAFEDALRLVKEAGYREYARFNKRKISLIPLP